MGYPRPQADSCGGPCVAVSALVQCRDAVLGWLMDVEAHDVDGAEMPGRSAEGDAAVDVAEFCGVHDQRSRCLAGVSVSVRIGEQLVDVSGATACWS